MNYSEQIYKLSEKLHWMQIAEDGILEFYLDNQMLQTFRMCEARFFEDYVEGYRAKGNLGRIWFLEFGCCVHEAIEIYYKDRKKGNFDLISFIGKIAAEIWKKYDMEYWSDVNLWAMHKYNSFKDLGGFLGFSALLLQYAQYFHVENERFRVIGTELYFGKNKEVPLFSGSGSVLGTCIPFRLYLSGKIDLLVDDGYSIGPMDHKTSRAFGGKNPAKNYEIQDGMTGYVFAAKKILQGFWNGEYVDQTLGKDRTVEPVRNCKKIWMNFLQVTPDKDMSKRFKRLPLYKTDWELEEYRQRQISTAARIYQLLENYREDGSGLRPFYNTMACTNYMHRECLYQSAHRQNSRNSQLAILNSDFVKDQSKIWNPENLEE